MNNDKIIELLYELLYDMEYINTKLDNIIGKQGDE